MNFGPLKFSTSLWTKSNPSEPIPPFGLEKIPEQNNEMMLSTFFFDHAIFYLQKWVFLHQAMVSEIYNQILFCQNLCFSKCFKWGWKWLWDRYEFFQLAVTILNPGLSAPAVVHIQLITKNGPLKDLKICSLGYRFRISLIAWSSQSRNAPGILYLSSDTLLRFRKCWLLCS